MFKSSSIKLVNKLPLWNDGLKCWCLNFRGRVKLASVKNFQLMSRNDANGRIVMQFGKVTLYQIIKFSVNVAPGVLPASDWYIHTQRYVFSFHAGIKILKYYEAYY